MLKDEALKYYGAGNYNCAETIIRAANDYYGLGLCEHDMKMVAGFGGGIQSGNVCGTLLSSVSALSMKYVEAKAHDSADIRPVTNSLLRRFNEAFGSQLCRDIKVQHFSKEFKCRETILMACDILENTINDYEAQKAENA